MTSLVEKRVSVISEICPVIEALLYCTNRACGYTVERELQELCLEYPESKDDVTAAFQPIVELERLLDSATTGIDDERLHFFFDRIGEEDKHPRGYSVANSLLMPTERERRSALPFCGYAENGIALSQSDIIVRMRVALAINSDSWATDDCADIASFMGYIRQFPASDADRYRLVDAAVNYKEYIGELYSMLAPIVDLIVARHDLYAPLLARFSALYSNVTFGELNERFSCGSERPITLAEMDQEIELVPCLFNHSKLYSVTFGSEDDSLIVSRIEMHILQDMTAACKRRDIPLAGIAHCVKALGDPTRLKILSMLRNHEVYVQELTEKTGLSFTAISHHMTKLMLAGLVSCERRGNCVYYFSNENSIQWLIDKVSSLLLNDAK